MDIRADLGLTRINNEDLEKSRPLAEKAMADLWSGNLDYTGWVRWPLDATNKESDLAGEVERVKTVALAIQNKCKLFVVIGIGGSYLGARSASQALGPREGYPKLRFAGNNLSSTYHAEILEEVYKNDTCICVISKSGTTTESSIAFSIFKEVLIEKYGEKEAYKRIFAVTDADDGILCRECSLLGYTKFEIPRDVGGRYSVLTPVGLLPLAVAGYDVDMLLEGAYESASNPGWDHGLADYAITRYLLGRQGKQIEIFEYYEPRFFYFTEWLKQLFGESEGKEGKGLFPVSLNFTADLHSMGQFLQEGKQIFFETVLDLLQPGNDLTVTEKGNPFQGKTMNQVNKAAQKGVSKAHEAVGIPMVTIEIPQMDERRLGQLFYYFMMTCGISALMLGVNPFDQPGVEAYKNEMRKEL